MKHCLLIVLFLVVALSIPAHAEECPTPDLGWQEVSVPCPKGFVGLQGGSPSFARIWQEQSEDFQLLEIYLTPKDLNEIQSGSNNQSRRKYLIAEIGKTAVGRAASDTVFAQYVVKVKTAHPVSGKDTEHAVTDFFGRSYEPALGITRNLDTAGASESELGSFLDEHDAFGYLTGINYPDRTKAVVATVALHIRNRVFYIHCAASAQDLEDARWAEREAIKWTQMILMANR